MFFSWSVSVHTRVIVICIPADPFENGDLHIRTRVCTREDICARINRPKISWPLDGAYTKSARGSIRNLVRTIIRTRTGDRSMFSVYGVVRRNNTCFICESGKYVYKNKNNIYITTISIKILNKLRQIIVIKKKIISEFAVSRIIILMKRPLK